MTPFHAVQVGLFILTEFFHFALPTQTHSYTVDDFPNLNKKVYHTKPDSEDGEAYITVLHYNPNVVTCVIYSKERPLDGSLRIEMETNDAGLCKMISNVKETSGTGFLTEYQLVPNYDGSLVGSYILECRAGFRRVGKINAMFFVTFPLEKSSALGRSLLLEHYKSTDLLELHINRSRGWFRVGHTLILFIRLGSHNVVGEKSFGGLLPILSVDLTIAPAEDSIKTHGMWKSREVEVEELEGGRLRISLNCTGLAVIRFSLPSLGQQTTALMRMDSLSVEYLLIALLTGPVLLIAMRIPFWVKRFDEDRRERAKYERSLVSSIDSRMSRLLRGRRIRRRTTVHDYVKDGETQTTTRTPSGRTRTSKMKRLPVRGTKRKRSVMRASIRRRNHGRRISRVSTRIRQGSSKSERKLPSYFSISWKG